MQHRMLSQNKKSMAPDIKLRRTDLNQIARLKEICLTGKDSLLTYKTCVIPTEYIPQYLVYSQILVLIYLIANLTYREVWTKKTKLKPTKTKRNSKHKDEKEILNYRPLFLKYFSCFFYLPLLASLHFFFFPYFHFSVFK